MMTPIKRFLSGFQVFTQVMVILHSLTVSGQTSTDESQNIYSIKKQFFRQVLHNPQEVNETTDDNDLQRFNRWFHFVEPRCFPSGNLPSPDILWKECEKLAITKPLSMKTTASWMPLGPMTIPPGSIGIGRINCIAMSPVDTNTVFVGAACGGVWKSTDGGATWGTTTDNIPSLSIADIVIDPLHPDTIFAATGDGYGWEWPSMNYIFWGGLYSAGILKSYDGGATWSTTGLSFQQANTEIIQKLLIHPSKPNILLAGTRSGIYRTTDGGTNWTVVDTGHVYSMAFRPNRADTVYAVNAHHLRVSHDAGATWTTLQSSISPGGRSTLAVTPASPASIYLINGNDALMISHDEGASFINLGSTGAAFYGNYDRVLTISPADTDDIYTFGASSAVSHDGAQSFGVMGNNYNVHPDNHACLINPLNPSAVYVANDGGLFLTRNDGISWMSLNNGLDIAQVYRLSCSRQQSSYILCGTQDNANFSRDAAGVWQTPGIPYGDGADNTVFPLNDSFQVASLTGGQFFLTKDRGATFTYISPTAAGPAGWLAPVVFNPHSSDTIYFGFDRVIATYNGGVSTVSLGGQLFPTGAVAMAIAPSNPSMLYAADYSKMYRSSNGGATWTDVTNGLPSNAITSISVDDKDAQHVYVSFSGYSANNKVFHSFDGGTTWVNLSNGLPNLPANCIAVDSSMPGAVFVGTDMGLYYRDSLNTAWTIYNTGLPNVVIDDIDVNYASNKVRVATYGRGVWECSLGSPAAVPNISVPAADTYFSLLPNPASRIWRVHFNNMSPRDFSVRVLDIQGKVMVEQKNSVVIDLAQLAAGSYVVEVVTTEKRYQVKGVKI